MSVTVSPSSRRPEMAKRCPCPLVFAISMRSAVVSRADSASSEFAALYTAQFGEAPSMTVARSQQRP
jgi:hypothetical protein